MFNTFNYINGGRNRRSSPSSSSSLRISSILQRQKKVGKSKSTTAATSSSDELSINTTNRSNESYCKQFRRIRNQERTVALLCHVNQQKEIRQLFQGGELMI